MASHPLTANTRERYHLRPGEVFVSRHDVVISTVLGSCVAVCLWEERRGIGGMNHIIFPTCREGEVLSTRYAKIGTLVLYDLMKEEGANHQQLSARVFGGATALASFREHHGLAVGNRNIEIVETVLNKLNIPVTGKDIKGHNGRKILFDLKTGKIRMNLINNYSFNEEKSNLSQIDLCGTKTSE